MVRRILIFLCLAAVLVPMSGCSLQRDTFEIYYNRPEAVPSTTFVPTGTIAAAASNDDAVWISTKGGTKYHKLPDCSSMTEAKQIPLEDATKQGFTPCKRCFKDSK